MSKMDFHWQYQWSRLARRWQDYLTNAGLGEIVQAAKMVFKPLAPLVAQVLWFAQPGFALFGSADSLAALAELLDDPDSLAENLDQTEDK